MATRRSMNDNRAAGIANISRTRRAQLVAEFEGDLGIDHRARATAAADERRWQVIKTIIVWTIALIFFTIACQKLWIIGQDVDRPFSDVNFLHGWFED